MMLVNNANAGKKALLKNNAPILLKTIWELKADSLFLRPDYALGYGVTVALQILILSV
jgi:hypothetical protein